MIGDEVEHGTPSPRICRICDLLPVRQNRSYCGLCETIRNRMERVLRVSGRASLIWAERERLIRRASRALVHGYVSGVRNYYVFRWPEPYFDLSKPEEVSLLFSPENGIITDSRGTLARSLSRHRDRSSEDLRNFAAWKRRLTGGSEGALKGTEEIENDTNNGKSARRGAHGDGDRRM